MSILAKTALVAAAIPDPPAAAPPGMESVTIIISWIKWGGIIVCVAGLIGAGALMAIQSRRGEGGEHVHKIAMALAGVVVIGAAAAMIGVLAPR